MTFVRQSEEIFVSDAPVTTVTAGDIAFLKEVATHNRRRTARLCAHPDTANALHEMLIVHMRGLYVQPHKHLGKSESFHMIEGRLKIFLFDDAGEWQQTIDMVPPGQGGVFYYRLNTETFHSVLPETDFVVFHEVTNGPFDPADRIDADWAPGETGDPARQAAFIESWLNGVGRPPDNPGAVADGDKV